MESRPRLLPKTPEIFGLYIANWQYKPAKCKNLIVFQMTEVAVPRALFREILKRISRLTLAAVTPGTG